MFQTSPDQSSTYLAEIYKEFLLQREDCLRTLRVFLRELVRVLRFDMNIIQFTKVFLNGKFEFMEQVERCEFRDRIFQSMIDIVCLCMLLSVTPQIREASIPIRSTKDIKNNAMLLQFYAQMSTIQLDSISWMYETVPKFFKPQTSDYSQALYKLLLLDNPEQYSRCDQWPSEPERGTLLRIISETPIREDTLLRIILIGITKEIPFTIPDTIDIIMLVIKRASTMKIMNCPAVQTDKYDIIDFLFSMVEYHHPENIKLPADYEPPKLAITTLYWKAWLIMLMISAHNPATFGAFCWEQYPMMKQLIEMCITNQFPEQNAGKEELQKFTRIFSSHGQSSSEQRISGLLVATFPKANIKVVDVSNGCGTMFEVFVEASEFKGLHILQQHKLVTGVLKDQIKEMHGIRIHTSVPKLKT